MTDFNLSEFRKKYPIKPHARVEYEGGEWEAISYPWPNVMTFENLRDVLLGIVRATWRPEDGARINIRKKGDPTSMVEVDAAEVRPICEHDRSKGCEICGT